ncbi:MAG: MgtC/SapB family protein [Pseudomonadota bacterium]
MSFSQLIMETLNDELSDINDLPSAVRIMFRLLLAACLGGLLGYDREAKGKGAGVRTHMLVALGSAMFVFVPQQAGASMGDITRILQGLVAGIGFLGSGVIIKNEKNGDTKGMTTAAGIWLTAALGMTVGMGREATAIISTVLALIIIALVPKVEKPKTHIKS